MNQPASSHLKNLKSALLRLPATGEDGFEGLIGAALEEISGVPFRLAGSGLQFGIDGKPAYDSDSICFEGKRYDGRIPRAEIITKIADLARGNAHADQVWVLGATSALRVQLADDVRADGRVAGISVLILDWSSDLPPFAVALAMGGTRVEGFLNANVDSKSHLQKSLAALAAIRTHKDFAVHAKRLKGELDAPSVGTGLARQANCAWLNDVFSSRQRARTKLRQPLSPADDALQVETRRSLLDRICPYFSRMADQTVVCVSGGEGHGKSWIVAQSWLSLAEKPLMVFLNADDFAEAAGDNDIEVFLITKLIEQTADARSDVTHVRWRKRFANWRHAALNDQPRLVVVIDGINQKPTIDWARVIDKIYDELTAIGGRLIVTSRTSYFHDRIRRRLTTPISEISIPEWTPAERNTILTGHGITSTVLHSAVANSLCNPRLLGIALELFDKNDVTAFQELSFSRLLFEHIRTSERETASPQPVDLFVKRLRDHAKTILLRVGVNADDLSVFETDTLAVADGRFFQTLEGDSSRYTLKEEGLTLALGFAVVDRLRIASRNGRDLESELAAILEPVAALDDTANVLLAALTAVVADNNSDAQLIAKALIWGFVSLQNPDQATFPIFAGLTKRMPQAFLDAARSLCLTDEHQSNFDWLEAALIEAGKNPAAWSHMTNEIGHWLSVHSLSPELGMLSHHSRDPQEKVQKEREKNQKEIDENLRALSREEHEILRRLPSQDGNLSRLTNLALLLMAGKPLAPFASGMVNFSFSYALNADHGAPYKDLIHLVSLNRVDWRETRRALLKASDVLRGGEVSRTGKWALITVLRATGDSEDSKEAESLADDLTKDRARIGPWRRIDDYCSNDPCDPSSIKPENVDKTAEQYRALDVTTIRQEMSQRSEDHFFVDARPAVARFAPEIAIAKHRELATDVLTRNGFALRQGILELREHTALLTSEHVADFVKRYAELRNLEPSSELTEKDIWFISQYHLLIAFPALEAVRQAEILLTIDEKDPVLLELMNIMKPLSEKEFDRLIETAQSEGDEYKLYLMLEIAKATTTQLSTDACNFIATLVKSDVERIRAQALGVAAKRGDATMLMSVAESEWDAANANTDNGFESWYGSAALLRAAAKGLIDHCDAVHRLSPQLLGRAAKILNAEAVPEIVKRIDASIRSVAELEAGDLVAPDIELQLQPDRYEPSRFNVSEKTRPAKDAREAFERLFERNDRFEEKQRLNFEAFDEFRRRLTKANARIILDRIGIDEFEAMVTADPTAGGRWYALFMETAAAKLSAIHNLALLLAHALSKTDPDKAAALFHRLGDSRPLVRFTFGKVGVELDAIASWSGGPVPVLDQQRFLRLDRAETDHELSVEVLAGLMNGQQALLARYIEEKLSREEPAEIARGIMVVGFSDHSPFNEGILARYATNAGLIGRAQKAAQRAYERNRWARRWFEQMCFTGEPTDFWRCSVLFARIVDGRFAVWRDEYVQSGVPIKDFGPSVDEKIRNRYEKWEKQREKWLFGSDAPEPIFVNG